MMKTKYEYIYFEYNTSEDYERWEFYNKHDELLGWVEYDNNWEEYVSCCVDSEIVINNTCHSDIAHFLTQLNKKKEAE